MNISVIFLPRDSLTPSVLSKKRSGRIGLQSLKLMAAKKWLGGNDALKQYV